MRTFTRVTSLMVFALSIGFFPNALQAQNHFGTPVITGGFGNAVLPAGTAANFPGTVRWTPNAVFPGGGGPHLAIPGKREPRYTGTGAVVVPYAYPVYVSGYDNGAAPEEQPPAQSGVTVVYPPQQAPPVIVKQYSEDQAQIDNADPNNPEPVSTYQPQRQPDGPQTDSYLIALKDHTIYSVIAYWVDGDTLHYFTAGNVHNQVSTSLVDRALTTRLNKELGATVNIPGGQDQ